MLSRMTFKEEKANLRKFEPTLGEVRSNEALKNGWNVFNGRGNEEIKDEKGGRVVSSQRY